MIKHILFDFDGVILDSLPIREHGFRVLLKNHPPALVEQLVAYHRENGGLSRYAKIRYFHRELLGQEISEEKVNELAGIFSSIVKERLCDRGLLIETTMRFIVENHKKYSLHVVSGSDQSELREVCVRLEIAKYFRSLHGSPAPKDDLVALVMIENGYLALETALVGDSINDLAAARKHGLRFVGFNNVDVAVNADIYIRDFTAELESGFRRMEEAR